MYCPEYCTYCEVLEEHLFPFYQAIKAVLNDEPWFMDDNCRIHTLAETRAFKNELEIRSLEWPSQSPDLNPIENLWKLWKDNIQKITSPPKNHQELIAAAQEAWEQLKMMNISQSLANSIKDASKPQELQKDNRLNIDAELIR